MKTYKIALFSSLFLLPVAVFAQPLLPLYDLAYAFLGIIRLLIPIVVVLALVFFFWGLAKYILKAGDEKAKEEGRRLIIGGIIAIFVMVAIWGIVAFIADSLGIGIGGVGPVPGVDIPPPDYSELPE